MNTRISPSAVDAGKLKEDALTTRWLPRFWTPFHRFQIVKYQCIFKKGQEKQKESKCQSKTMSIEVEILPKWAQSQPTEANPKWGEYSNIQTKIPVPETNHKYLLNTYYVQDPDYANTRCARQLPSLLCSSA